MLVWYKPRPYRGTSPDSPIATLLLASETAGRTEVISSMNARRHCGRPFAKIYCSFAATWLLLAVTPPAAAQSQTSAAAESRQRAGRSRLGLRQSYDGTNPSSEADIAFGSMIDSLFAPLAPEDPLPQAAVKAMGVEPTKAARRPTWQARLVHNPDTSEGNPPYALADRYGGVMRYVEPVDGVDLERFIGQSVGVRRDTGHTLLATQLDLPRGRSGNSGVRQAAFQAEPTPADAPDGVEPIPVGEEIEPYGQYEEYGEFDGYDQYGEPMIIPDGVDPLYLDQGIDFGGCDACGSAVCGGQCGYGSRPVWYVRGEYLLWWFDGMQTPPLVVEGDASPNDGGTPGDPSDDTNDFVNAVIVYGNEQILDRSRDGGRVTVGTWLDDYGRWGMEADYLAFSRLDEQFIDGGDGVTLPFVGRPFIDATSGLNAVEDVSFPGIRGNVVVDSESRFESAGVRFRHSLCCVPGCATQCGDGVACGSLVGCDTCTGGFGCGSGVGMGTSGPLRRLGALLNRGTRRTDVFFGVRWAQLNENLGISEDLTETGDFPQTTFLVNDGFGTSNEFVGGELGYVWEWQHQRWSLELLSKLAIGNTRQHVMITGGTTRDQNDGGGAETRSGGLLALDSNIGNYERDQFSVLPEVGVTAGYLLTDRLRFTVGYTLLYWSRVVRPGDQIDLEVNPTLLPFSDADPGLPARPQFVFRDTDFWGQGVNFGVDYRY